MANTKKRKRMVIQGRNHEDSKSLLVLYFASMGSWTPSYSAGHYCNKMPEITAYKEGSFGSVLAIPVLLAKRQHTTASSTRHGQEPERRGGLSLRADP